MRNLRGYGPLVIRLVLGIIFVLYGWNKVLGLWGYVVNGDPWSFVELVSFMPLLPAVIWAILSTLAEFLGGILVLLGMEVRWAAVFLSIDMLVAIFGVGLPGNVELELCLLAMAVSLILSGAGRYSIKFQR